MWEEYRSPARPNLSATTRPSVVVGRAVELLDSVLDVAAGVDRLDVQATRGDQPVMDRQEQDASHGKGRAVRVMSPPLDLAPLDRRSRMAMRRRYVTFSGWRTAWR